MSKEGQGPIQKDMAATSEKQHKVLERLTQGKVVELFLDVAAEIAPQHRSVEVRLSTPTGDPKEVPTVALVVDGKRRISAFEYVAPNGHKLFRLRQGFDDPDPKVGTAATLDNKGKRFSGEYGHQRSLRNASEILHKAVDGYAAFNGGVSDISFRGGFMYRALGKYTPPLESPYRVLLHLGKR
jgi:hypothetical protein